MYCFISTRKCSKCKIEKPITCYGKWYDGYRAQCKSCISLAGKEYRLKWTPEQKEIKREYLKEYHQKIEQKF